MKCAYHQDSIAVGQCSNCGCYVCPQCYTMVNEKMYCNMCAGHVFRKEPIAKVGTPPAIASGNISGPVTAAVVPREIKKANWFQRHLNWTWVFSILLGLVVAFIAGVLVVLADPSVSEDTLSAMGKIFMWIILLVVSGWVIKQKGRSLWWLLLVGWFSPLWLGNKKR